MRKSGSLQGWPDYEVHLVLPADLVASSVVPFPLFFPCLVRVVHVDEGRKVMRFKAVSGNCFGNHAGFVCITRSVQMLSGVSCETVSFPSCN